MVITIGACSNLGNLIPNKFDNVGMVLWLDWVLSQKIAKECDGSLVM